MNDGPPTDSPEDHDVTPTQADSDDAGIEDAFDLVRNELRVSILQALAQAQAESPFDPALRSLASAPGSTTPTRAPSTTTSAASGADS